MATPLEANSVIYYIGVHENHAHIHRYTQTYTHTQTHTNIQTHIHKHTDTHTWRAKSHLCLNESDFIERQYGGQ